MNLYNFRNTHSFQTGRKILVFLCSVGCWLGIEVRHMGSSFVQLEGHRRDSYTHNNFCNFLKAVVAQLILPPIDCIPDWHSYYCYRKTTTKVGRILIVNDVHLTWVQIETSVWILGILFFAILEDYLGLNWQVSTVAETFFMLSTVPMISSDNFIIIGVVNFIFSFSRLLTC